MKLDDWRKEIDRIDSEIINLLNQRARAAQNVGELKMKSGLPIVDTEREDEILRKIVRENEGIIENETVIHIYGKILQKSRQIQIDTMKKLVSEKGGC